MSAHTPGPWDWEPPMPHQDFCEVEHKCNAPGAASRIVARVTCRTAWFGEQQANARLIAAAPELLEALQELVYGIEHPTSGRFETAMPQARAAIAKATGEQP